MAETSEPQEKQTELKIFGFGLNGYRSFGSELQEIGPFTKVNVFAGQNNSGKSNILRFVERHYDELRQKLDAGRTPQRKRELVDQHVGTVVTTMRCSLLCSRDADIVREAESRIRSNSHTRRVAEAFLECLGLGAGSGHFWLRFQALPGQGDFVADPALTERFRKVGLDDSAVETLANVLTGGQSARGDMNATVILRHFAKAVPAVPEREFVFIPGLRRIGDGGAEVKADFSGVGIIDRLAKLQHPSFDQQHFKREFETIEGFLREVTSDADMRLEVPEDKRTIHVITHNRVLPIEALGTGIHEVVILAAAASVHRNRVICMEEPELHLHPVLQRKLLRYLIEKTHNQYFITTHSAAFLDFPDISVFHVTHDGKATSVKLASCPATKFSICADLGYRASDLFQTNCVIWVEGPSDRVYLNAWIVLCDPSLREGIDYSIMFYGGRLLNHLSATDAEVTEFINLRRINRHIAVVMDSDKSGPRARINDTKRRIVGEFLGDNGMAWVTKGREIENYIAPDVMTAVLKQLAPDSVRRRSNGLFDHAIPVKNGRPIADKLKLANAAVVAGLTLDHLDLKARIAGLCDFIRRANQRR